MRLIILLISSLALAGCKPSSVFGPDSQKEELLGEEQSPTSMEVPAPPSLTYPSGEWDDGFGNVWRSYVTGDSLVAELDNGSSVPLIMLGTIQHETLSYQVSFSDNVPIAQGQARLIDAAHAVFETYNYDGSLNTHGLVHFNHSSDVPTGQPVELRPQGDLPDTEIKGD